MKKGLFVVVFIALLPVTGHANDFYLVEPAKMDFDFIAPIVNAEADVPVQAGLIFYDIGAGLKVVNPSGGIDILSSPGAAAVTSGGTERVERATFVCGSPSSITTQNGAWLDSVDNMVSGNCVINFETGTFTAVPSCVTEGHMSDDNFIMKINSPPTTSGTVVRCYNSSTAADASNCSGAIICMGPR